MCVCKASTIWMLLLIPTTGLRCLPFNIALVTSKSLHSWTWENFSLSGPFGMGWVEPLMSEILPSRNLTISIDLMQNARLLFNCTNTFINYPSFSIVALTTTVLMFLSLSKHTLFKYFFSTFCYRKAWDSNCHSLNAVLTRNFLHQTNRHVTF